MEDILVAKRKGNKLKLKISKKKRDKYSEPMYRKTLNPKDPNDLALFLSDLRLYFNSAIDNAYKIYKKDEADMGSKFWIFGKQN